MVMVTIPGNSPQSGNSNNHHPTDDVITISFTHVFPFLCPCSPLFRPRGRLSGVTQTRADSKVHTQHTSRCPHAEHGSYGSLGSYIPNQPAVFPRGEQNTKTPVFHLQNHPPKVSIFIDPGKNFHPTSIVGSGRGNNVSTAAAIELGGSLRLRQTRASRFKNRENT